MTKVSRSCSSALLTLAMAAGLGLGDPGCVAQFDEPASAEPAVGEQAAPRAEPSGPAMPATLQIVFACEDPSGDRVGLPKSTLAFCQAACPAGDSCVRCIWESNVLECP